MKTMESVKSGKSILEAGVDARKIDIQKWLAAYETHEGAGLKKRQGRRRLGKYRVEQVLFFTLFKDGDTKWNRIKESSSLKGFVRIYPEKVIA